MQEVLVRCDPTAVAGQPSRARRAAGSASWTGWGGDAGFQLLQGDGRPGEPGFAGISLALLHPAQTDPQEAQATFPVDIDLVSRAGEADGKPPHATDQNANG